MTKFCCHCYYWVRAYESGGRDYGKCENPVLHGKVVVEKGDEKLSEERMALFTQCFFCCNHFTMTDGSNTVTRLPTF